MSERVDPGTPSGPGGVVPTVVAPTPMPLRSDDGVDHDALARNVERWNATDLAGFVVGSAGGEETYLDEAEILAAARTVGAARAPGKIVIGGIDTPSVTKAIGMAENYAAAGADRVRVRIPQRPDGSGRGNVVDYFQAVCAASPVPVIVIHQTWQTGGVAATPEQIGELCSFPNVSAYIHWHNVRFESYVATLLPEHVPIWSPNGSLLLPSTLLGATGACAFFANWAPGLVRRILELGMAGDITGARPLQRALLRADYLGMQYGVRALKAGLEMLGYEGTVPRRPVPPLDEPHRQALHRALAAVASLDDGMVITTPT